MLILEFGLYCDSKDCFYLDLGKYYKNDPKLVKEDLKRNLKIIKGFKKWNKTLILPFDYELAMALKSKKIQFHIVYSEDMSFIKEKYKFSGSYALMAPYILKQIKNIDAPKTLITKETSQQSLCNILKGVK